jgi:prepilin-type N-terminal cleavage/methylation domain-containing protein
MKTNRFQPTARGGFTLVEIMIVVAIIGVLIAIAVPNFVKTRTQARKQLCIENLAQFESAKQIWGVEHGKKDGDVVTEPDLIGPTLYIKEMPACPAGGSYDLRTIGRNATCSEDGHVLE